MTFSSFLLILRRQFVSKWGRFLLASGGIMIGIWAITLTSSLSFGLSDTIVKAINSQPGAKEFSLSKTPSGQTSFFDINEAPTFTALSQKDFDEIKSKYPAILDIAPSTFINTYLLSDSSDLCSAKSKDVERLFQITLSNPTNITDEQQTALEKARTEFESSCTQLTIPSAVFQNFYETNRTNWFGQTEAPKVGEIATCFKCGSLDFYKKYNVSEPNDLIGKEIILEFNQAPEFYSAGEQVSVTDSSRDSKDLATPLLKTLKIVSVIDDREANTFGGGNTNFYIDYSYFFETIKLSNPSATIENTGYLQASVFLKSYEDLDTTITSLQNDKYLPLSIVQGLIAGVRTTFTVLTIVLAGFGLIALIASVFGIVNVMTISVLERRKEIGILKSLGARDSDIFSIFLLESAALGFIGWLMGTLLSLIFGWLISFGFQAYVNSNEDWKNNLDSLNITSFAPSFPWWLLGGTLLLALFFTIISGVFPATKAGKQNPVEVLRSE